MSRTLSLGAVSAASLLETNLADIRPLTTPERTQRRTDSGHPPAWYHAHRHERGSHGVDADPGPNGASADEYSHVAESPGVCGGYPVIRGTRIPVRIVVWLNRTLGTNAIQREWYPYLAKDRIQGALDYYAAHPERVDEDFRRHERAYAKARGVPWPA